MHTLLKRSLPSDCLPCGESWELSDRPEAQSTVISAGPFEGLSLHQLWTEHREAVFGMAMTHHPAERFPLLLKVLDACSDLSIQVHPPATIAAQLGGEPKTECWFIAHADPGAKLYVGLKQGVTRQSFAAAVTSGTVAEHIHVIEPQAGDFLFIPSGRLHAIGAGLLIYEIQQNSDTTYRVFDWNRLGLDGQPRQLHVAESLAAIDFDDAEPTLHRSEPGQKLADCPHFSVAFETISPGQSLGGVGECLILIVTQGQLDVAGTLLKMGDFALLRADAATSQRHVSATTPGTHCLLVTLPPPA